MGRHQHGGAAPAPDPPGGDLLRLVEAEDEIARSLDRARDEAAALESEARQVIARAEAPWAARLEAEIDARRRELQEASRLRLREIEARTEQQVARFDAIVGERVEALAAGIVERLLEELEREAAATDAAGTCAPRGDEHDHPHDDGPRPGAAHAAS